MRHTDTAREKLRSGDLPGALADIRLGLDALKDRIEQIPDDALLTADDVTFFVNDFLEKQSPKDYEGESINWAGLRCIDVNLNHEQGKLWIVISEASPECSKLPAAIEAIFAAPDMECTVFCEW